LGAPGGPKDAEKSVYIRVLCKTTIVWGSGFEIVGSRFRG